MFDLPQPLCFSVSLSTTFYDLAEHVDFLYGNEDHILTDLEIIMSENIFSW